MSKRRQGNRTVIVSKQPCADTEAQAERPDLESTAQYPAIGRTLILYLNVIVVLLGVLIVVSVMQFRQNQTSEESLQAPQLPVSVTSSEGALAGSSIPVEPAVAIDRATRDDRVQEVFERWDQSAPEVAAVFENVGDEVVISTSVNMCAELASSTLDQYLANADERLETLSADPAFGLEREEWVVFYTDIATVFCPS